MKKPLAISISLFLFLFGLAFAKGTHNKSELRRPANHSAGFVKAE